MLKKLNQHVIISAVVYLFVGIVLIGLKSVNDSSSGYPRFLMYTMAVLNTFLLIDGITRTKNGSTEKQSTMVWNDVKYSFATTVIVFLYVVAIQFLGYFIASAGVIIGLLFYYKVRSWKTITFYTVIYLIFAYVVFVILLKVRLV